MQRLLFFYQVEDHLHCFVLDGGGGVVLAADD